MTTQLITAPEELAVSLDDAKTNLRIELDDTSLDSMITVWLEGITAHAEHYMQRSIINQTWRCTLDRFPDAFKLYYPPIVSVSAVRFYDTDGELQTLDPADYRLDNVSEPGYLVPAPGKRWPDTDRERINAVMVDYVAGYGASDAATPPAIRSYLLAKLSEQFDPATRPEKETVQSSFIDRLLDRHKIWSVG